MTPTPCLYVGRTIHARLTPFKKRFAYRIASLFLDVDALDAADTSSPVFSVDRFNLFSFHRRDHGARRDAPLRPWAEAAFRQAGVTLDGGAVRLLSFPRVLGYAFKPVSLWFGYGPDGALRGVIYEVNNTFGDTHAYVAPATSQAAADKIFYVSPFFPARGRYDFHLHAPDETFKLAIRYNLDSDAAMVATQSGARQALNTTTLLRVFFTQPLMTVKVIVGIHWEALLLWRRGATYHRRPTPPTPVSVATRAPQP